MSYRPRTKLYKTENFVIGNQKEGHAVYRRRGGECVSTVWLGGEVVRSDIWASCGVAKQYAFDRAKHHGTYGKRVLRKAAEKHGVR